MATLLLFTISDLKENYKIQLIIFTLCGQIYAERI